MDITELLEIDETVNGVTGSVSAGCELPMRGYAGDEAIGHTDVEISRAAGEDVDPEVVFAISRH
jgi:hypothetical protein